MRKLIAGLLIAVAPALALAKNNPPNSCGNHGNNCNPTASSPAPTANAGAIGVGVGIGVGSASSSSRSNSASSSDSRSNSVATGGTAVAAGGSAQSGAVGLGGASQATNGNQSTSVTVNQVNPSDVRIRNTPSVNAWAAPPSATCVVTTGGSVNVPGFGGGLSTGVIDKQCEARENARFLASFGAEVEAVRVLCRAAPDVAKEVRGCADIHEEHEKRANERSRAVTPANQYNMAN